jgi:hypothetical protein
VTAIAIGALDWEVASGVLSPAFSLKTAVNVSGFFHLLLFLFSVACMSLSFLMIVTT